MNELSFSFIDDPDTELCCSERPAPRSDDLAAFGTMVFVEGEGENPRGGGGVGVLGEASGTRPWLQTLIEQNLDSIHHRE